MTIREILLALPWSEPKEYPVRGVRKLLKRAEPSEDFYKVWRDIATKPYLKALGITMKWRGKWMVHWWSDDHGVFHDNHSEPTLVNEK